MRGSKQRENSPQPSAHRFVFPKDISGLFKTITPKQEPAADPTTLNEDGEESEASVMASFTSPLEAPSA